MKKILDLNFFKTFGYQNANEISIELQTLILAKEASSFRVRSQSYKETLKTFMYTAV